MRDFLPEDVRRRDHVIAIIKRVYERYGFEPLETPAVETLETLLGKYGEEGNQLIFKILKRGEHEATGQADLALRYDLTVPLARVMAEHRAKLPRLFKRYQIQPVWRADRPARGRFREFYQCDIDAVGSTSPLIEAEQCAAVSDVLVALGFSDFTIRLNHRQLLTAVLETANVRREDHGTALIALDALDKVGWDGLPSEFEKRGIGPALEGLKNALLPSDVSPAVSKAALEGLRSVGEGAVGQPFRAAEEHSARALRHGSKAIASLADLEQRLEGHQAGSQAVENLKRILDLVQNTSAGGRLEFDPSLARGLSYYTGATMEVNVPDLAGSLGGGGRYDNLVGMFSGESIPACGFSLGLERILVVMGERGMFPPALKVNPADVLMAVFAEADLPDVIRAAGSLRAAGLRVLLYPEADKIGKQIKYAESRGIPAVAIMGESEIARGEVAIKLLAQRRQEVFPLDRAGEGVKALLGEVLG